MKKKHRKPHVGVVENCPDIQVAEVQYTFTHKQYSEQHNQTKYREHVSSSVPECPQPNSGIDGLTVKHGSCRQAYKMLLGRNRRSRPLYRRVEKNNFYRT
jgi:hypothetical protein